MNTIRIALLLAFIASVATDATAQTLYKLIDKNGKVTYSEEPPKNFDGKVIRMDIDPNANSATLTKPRAGSEGGGSSFQGELRQQAHKREQAKEQADSLRAELEEARKALEEARANPGDENLTFAGTAGKGTRPVPTEAYRERLAKMEAQVKRLEVALTKAESDAR